MKYALDQSKTDREIFLKPKSRTYKKDFFLGLNVRIGDDFFAIEQNTQ